MSNQLWTSSIWTGMKPLTLPTLDAVDLPESLRPAITAAAAYSERQGDIPTDLRDGLRDAWCLPPIHPSRTGRMGGAPDNCAGHLRTVRPYRRLGRVARLECELRLRRRH